MGDTCAERAGRSGAASPRAPHTQPFVGCMQACSPGHPRRGAQKLPRRSGSSCKAPTASPAATQLPTAAAHLEGDLRLVGRRRVHVKCILRTARHRPALRHLAVRAAGRGARRHRVLHSPHGIAACRKAAAAGGGVGARGRGRLAAACRGGGPAGPWQAPAGLPPKQGQQPCPREAHFVAALCRGGGGHVATAHQRLSGPRSPPAGLAEQQQRAGPATSKAAGAPPAGSLAAVSDLVDKSSDRKSQLLFVHNCERGGGVWGFSLGGIPSPAPSVLLF